MEWVKRKIRFSKRRNDKLSPWYIENGGKLLEGLIATSNGRYNIPYRVFTVDELNKAANYDFTSVSIDDSRLVMVDGTGYYISGIFQQRSILIKKFYGYTTRDKGASYAVNDIVVTVLMNRHKNVLKVLGCCLDLEIPAIIYEIGNINYGLLHDLLFIRKEGNFKNNIGRSLSWSNRLKIATDIANAVVYLHTTFPTPIIHRDLSKQNIFIDDHGVAKLVDFSLCIALPPGESQVELELDIVAMRKGYVDPEYMTSGIITEKCDVYSFGIILLELLTGLMCQRLYHVDDQPIPLPEYVKNHVDKNELCKILDPTILGVRGEIEQEHQLQAFSKLALRCTRDKGADRPEMIDVAKELMKESYTDLHVWKYGRLAHNFLDYIRIHIDWKAELFGKVVESTRTVSWRTRRRAKKLLKGHEVAEFGKLGAYAAEGTKDESRFYNFNSLARCFQSNLRMLESSKERVSSRNYKSH